jgi:hypothetical protein
MSELQIPDFSLSRLPEKSAEGPDFFSGTLKGKGNSGSTGLPLPRSPRKSDGFPFSLYGGFRRSPRDLRAEAERLANEIDQAETESAALCAIQDPFKDAFWHAHNALEVTLQTSVDRQMRLAAYDRRMIAGHQWYPHREPYKAVLRLLKALRTELKTINSEIGT